MFVRLESRGNMQPWVDLNALEIGFRKVSFDLWEDKR